MDTVTLKTNPVVDDLSHQYLEMLRCYIDRGGEDLLLRAYELGHQALEQGLGLLDMTYVHQQALSLILQENEHSHVISHDRLQLCVRAAAHFLDEALSPFEVSRLSSKDPNTALRRLYDVLEEESKRIAHVLHDESAQLLATVYLELAEIAREAPESVAVKVNQVVGYLDEVREQLRRLSHELRPLILDQLGLLPALRFLANGVKKRSGLEIEVEGDSGGRLPQPVEVVLYRTVQEALNNVTRHARASHVRIRVWRHGNTIQCAVRDDGVGFNAADLQKRGFTSLGVVGIRERVDALRGDFRIDSEPGKGTELKVAIPL